MNEKTAFLFLTSLVALTIFSMAGIWAIDVGSSGMIQGSGVVEGFSFVRTPVQHYHAGMVLLITSTFVIISLSYYIVISKIVGRSKLTKE